MRKISALALFLVLSFAPLSHTASLQQDTNRFSAGFKRVIGAPFQIPYQALRGTFYGPPGIGTIGGVLQGTFTTVGELAGGAFDMATAAAPYAKYALLA